MAEPITQAQFLEHCRDNEETALKLEKLMPLADLIPALEEIVENQLKIIQTEIERRKNDHSKHK